MSEPTAGPSEVEATIAHQSVAQLGGPGSILARQRREHERLDELLYRLAGTRRGGPAAAAEQNATLTDIGRLVFPHAFAEESVIWPLARKVLPDGEAITLRIEQEHQEINELWQRLESTPVEAPEREALLDRIVELLREDVRDEEDDLLPRLQAVLNPDELNRAGRSWAAVRRVAPTRPHPVVARRPPGNVVAALPLTVLDRSRDRLDTLSRRGQARPWRTAAMASRALGRAAARIEHVPPLTKGEDPSTSLTG
jgi:hemerythrin HHE cation binding domain-containing protein